MAKSRERLRLIAFAADTGPANGGPKSLLRAQAPGCDKQPPKLYAGADKAEALDQDFAVGEIR
jgi:hypothetical protein